MKPLTIIGGGLAGLTLGIQLRRHAIPVTIIEAGRYPRHRVCGEFISGAGLEFLRELELEGVLREAGAIPARSAAFFTSRSALFRRNLPSAALCISRLSLDAALAETFVKSGGELRTDERWPQREVMEGTICATGRRPHPTEQGVRWFGLKVHARDVQLQADLEMHFGKHGYVGLNRIASTLR